MTQVMTDQQLNRALAELMGYGLQEKEGSNGETRYSLVRPSGSVSLSMCSEECAFAWSGPKYCTNPAASLEVQAAVIKANPELYVVYLASIVDAVWDGSYLYMGPEWIALLLAATPRQRAEAAYLVLKGE